MADGLFSATRFLDYFAAAGCFERRQSAAAERQPRAESFALFSVFLMAYAAMVATPVLLTVAFRYYAAFASRTFISILRRWFQRSC